MGITVAFGTLILLDIDFQSRLLLYYCLVNEITQLHFVSVLFTSYNS